MNKALHPNDNNNILYMIRKEEGRKLLNINDCIDGAVQGLEKYINKNNVRLTSVTSNSNINRTTQISKSMK